MQAQEERRNYIEGMYREGKETRTTRFSTNVASCFVLVGWGRLFQKAVAWA